MKAFRIVVSLAHGGFQGRCFIAFWTS